MFFVVGGLRDNSHLVQKRTLWARRPDSRSRIGPGRVEFIVGSCMSSEAVKASRKEIRGRVNNSVR